ncbi:glycosyltransferase family 4 protein [Microbacterium oryzae]|uniref:glycosyltransferase family 4 protein n=1 Tax=Microbacterium oryzae TaxID=743009 RepID=UPI0025AFA843|nr:glycosyltransferase family 4 protein [Microbacterium oryzae]MDN3310453.1 glycosyltransferase family 4 protein [Microbacterium oryzae]
MSRQLSSNIPEVTMLWMESTRVGSAARTHMDGTRARLDAAGIGVREQIYSEAVAEGIRDKITRLLKLVRAGRKSAHRGVLVARWHPFLAFVAPRWLRKGGKVLLLVQGNDESAYETNPWLRRIPAVDRLMTRSLGCASAVLCVNEGLAEWVRSKRAGADAVPVEVMPSGVSDLFFDATPVPTEEPYVLFFGGLAPWQGIDYMLEAHRSSKWPSGLKLLVIGDGAKAATVERAQGATLEWLGPKRPAELARYVAGALVTLCPKSNTGSMAKVTTPFKMLESAAAGVPVIATDIPAQKDMLEEGYGLLVDAEQPSDLADAVARVFKDEQLRESLVARARDFSPKCRWTYAAPQLANMIGALERDIRS